MKHSLKKRKTLAGKSRAFSGGQRATIALRSWRDKLPRCAICGGMIDLVMGTQYDHITEHSKGGATIVENGRPTHPFCNNNRWTIERIKSGEQLVVLPGAGSPETSEKVIQLSFLTYIDYYYYYSPISGMSELMFCIDL